MSAVKNIIHPVTPVMLIILDGWGYGEQSDTNAVHVARTPNMDRWMGRYPFTTLEAHNGAVGLPEGQMGNSEVGHLNIGAGRTVYQDFTRINRAIESKEFFASPVLNNTMEQVLTNQSALHLLGLVSDGGVHSHLDHLVALVEMAAAKGLDRVYIHAFMDGRDTPPQSGGDYLRHLQQELDRIDRAAQTAEKHGLGITAGHGIGYKNVQPLVELGLIGEFVVGHAIVSRAVLCGLDQAVREMVRLIRPNSR